MLELGVLRELSKSASSGVTSVKKIIHLALDPGYADRVNQGITDCLGSHLHQYYPGVSGVLLGYEGVKLKKNAVMNRELPHIHLDIQATFYTFCPSPGSFLLGTVHKISEGHVGLWVHHVFYASILKKTEAAAVWAGSKLSVGDTVKFIVLAVSYRANRIIILGGSEDVVVGEEERKDVPTDFEPRILMSGLDRYSCRELAAIVTRLGGVVTDRPRWSTHLVMDKLNRTSNMLLCLPTVKHVLSTKWILESGKAGRWLEEGDYDLRDAKVEQHYEFSLSETLAKTKRDQLFKGVVFYITPSVQPSFDTLNKIIIHSGGRGARYAARRWSVDQMKEMNSAGHLFYIIITCEDDIHMVEDVLRAGIGVFSSEFVMSSVLRGGIDDDLSKYLTYADPSI